eukprot:CAMPEP_0194444584 /NCGR_PEP_ID=MMETSP0176-20130528/127362_1 /TAXON_ID=216777 /ORGANISM="Proboscia alata, Strain PI-D3" /LENGTH=149 /DNA_ID=CAMNT_0039270999 /DNA_START=525 /DNA_END=975 /DNA_ORIENTATION=+
MIRRMGLPDMLTDGYEGHIDGGYDPNQGGPEGGYDPNQPGGPGAPEDDGGYDPNQGGPGRGYDLNQPSRPGGYDPNQQGGQSSGEHMNYPSYDPNQQGGEAGYSSTDNWDTSNQWSGSDDRPNINPQHTFENDGPQGGHATVGGPQDGG